LLRCAPKIEEEKKDDEKKNGVTMLPSQLLRCFGSNKPDRKAHPPQ
jgi:hypothetical protein